MQRVSKKRQREASIEYNDAILKFQQSSPKVPGQCKAFTIAVYETLAIMTQELLTEVRQHDRFVRFRARQRYMCQMAKEVAFGPELKKMQETKARGKEKRQMRKTLFDKEKKRVVMFGQAQFGHGRQGPCHRKRCHRCGSKLVPGHADRTFRCSNNVMGGKPCDLDEIDRDVNAAIFSGKNARYICEDHSVIF